MLYHLYELHHAALTPARFIADHGQHWLRSAFNPMAYTQAGRMWAAGLDVFHHATARHGKPRFGLAETVIDGEPVPVVEEVVFRKTFGRLKRFRREAERDDPRVLLVAPMSGHHATLLRGTVAALLPDHDVFVTDWRDARDVPLWEGGFDLDDYVDYVIEFLRVLGPNTHVIAVCQPSVPVLAAVSLMAADGDPATPDSMVLMGGPIDTRVNPTVVNELAERRPMLWFRSTVITQVPPPAAGAMRLVYPGFLQLAGFLQMNLDRHIRSHQEMFNHLVAGDGESAAAKRRFYAEYSSVMDLTAEFYLETIERVFKEKALARGTFVSRGRPVEPRAIAGTALMTVEGELDDISGLGQTRAAHDLCSGVPAAMRAHWEQPRVGHYGIFNGRKWRDTIAPKVKAFIRAHDRSRRGRA